MQLSRSESRTITFFFLLKFPGALFYMIIACIRCAFETCAKLPETMPAYAKK